MKNIFLKRILPILLVICLVFSMTIIVSAEVVSTVLTILGRLALGIVIQWCAMEISEDLCEVVDDWDIIKSEIHQRQANNNDLFEFIECSYYSEDSLIRYGYIQVNLKDVSDLSDSTVECLTFVVDYINDVLVPVEFMRFSDLLILDENAFATRNEYISAQIYQDVYGGGLFHLPSYERLKELCFNAMNAYVAMVETGNEIIYTSEALFALAESGAIYTYSFDFVGPVLPSMMKPIMTTQTNLTKDGVFYSVPLRNNIKSSNHTYYGSFATSELAKSHAGSYFYSLYGNDNDGYIYKFKTPSTSYGICNYIIYDGHIYYRGCSSWTTPRYEVHLSNHGVGNDTGGNLANLGSKYYLDFNNHTGRLSDTSFDPYDFDSYYYGYCFLTENKNGLYPVDSSITYDDFQNTTGGGTVDIPYTDEEQLIVDSLGSGMVDVNDDISVDENGNITAVGGIMLETLDKLLTALKEGEIGLSSIQEYLETMVALMSSAKVSDNERAKLFSNINANIATIAQAIEQSKEAEKENVDFSTLLIEHTGLLEAIQLKNNLSFVQQLELLWTNLIGGSFNNVDNVNAVPDFTFYWDSNNDGLVEAYNALDLSWLDTPLTNNNLADKGRFDYEVTARQFLQWFIVIVVYSLFAIKAIKLLPTLIGGAGEAQHDSNTINFVK